MEGKTYAFWQRVVELPHIDLPQWLSVQEIFPKVFWKERNASVTHAALGALFSFDEVPDLPASELDVRIYGGLRFEKGTRKDNSWDGFPDKKFWLPQFEIVQSGKSTRLLIRGGVEGESEEERLKFVRTEGNSMEFSCLKEENVPCFEEWNETVSAILDAIKHTSVQKVVLARKRILYTNRALSGWSLLEGLLTTAIHTTFFAFEMQPNALFLGATPEQLFYSKGPLFQTEALAGTRPRGKDVRQDQYYQEELLHCSKETKEFSTVQTFLTSVLSDWSERMEWEKEPRILKNAHVQHLYNPLKAQLKAGIKNSELIEKLHPTPALGGFPKMQALQCIQQHEPFDRGWYGAPIGVVFPGGAHFAVGIRSALVKEREIHLFSGSGIVRTSNPLLEWEELNQKIRPFLSLLPMEKALYG